MPKSCCVPGCQTNKLKNPELRYYCFPAKESLRIKWISAIHRAKVDDSGRVKHNKNRSPKSKSTYVCSLHFISGRKENFEKHPDAIPSKFPWTNIRSPSKISKINSCNDIVSPHLQLNLPEISGRIQRCQRRIKRASVERKLISNPKSIKKELSGELYDFKEGVEFSVNDVEMETFTDDMNLQLPVVSSPSELTFSLQSPIFTSEREGLYNEMDELRNERDWLKIKNIELKLAASPFSLEALKQNPSVCMMLTGLDFIVLEKTIIYVCEDLFDSTRPTKLSSFDQVIITIIKLKQNLNFDLIAYISNISKTTAIEYFYKWLDIMYWKLNFLIKMQDRDHIFDTIPGIFKAKFPRLTSIIDCFEIFVEAPSSLLARAQFYSRYKRHCTIKVFISCTPLGAINFLSKCYGGRASDILITRESGFSSKHMPGDQILADHRFTLQEDFAARSSAELIPAFTRGKKQLLAKEIETSRKIASVRIHIERVIGLMKNRYTILKGIIPLKIIKNIKDESANSILANCDKIVTVCAALTNLGESIVFNDMKI
ncbi:uncharacterized protein LOC136085018 [Hydra vulgaris]|uniref:Uncharacterized protein LOC136085018 n=1 Tax=Hydra vulgaris TaxID=6087 RepID=A0ABM4CL11_HYDVU